ncbi:MAG: ABC-ATPase domain-containing protein [Lachnospiraceae bacterium]|nr:ABC-ATPase domain-containing protein [Lachnospiraceae bacterium]
MRSQADLKRQLKEIDHKGYKSYKVLEGEYDFGAYRLSIDHEQGDRFATPSRVRIIYKIRGNIAPQYFENRHRKIAVEDYLLRRLHRNLKTGGSGKSGSNSGRREKDQVIPFDEGDKYERKNGSSGRVGQGSGKSGLVTACRTGQEILERTAMRITPEVIEARIEVGFPAYGRTIAAGELEKILFDFLPEVARKTFQVSRVGQADGIAPSLRSAAGCLAHLETLRVGQGDLDAVIALADDQQYVREALDGLGLVAFVADGSILPRESGVSQHPMKNAVVFKSPESLAVTLALPHRGNVRGMGIKKGITVIAGGGFHGKSTLLKALERGVYNHIPGDGRELVITDQSAFKLRAEEGRCIHDTDISMFINNLPSHADTAHFSTENASGSTSQAANTVEALSAGSRLLLIDEDTSATNFMVRDVRMAKLVSDEKEPITPFIRKIRGLYQDFGVSTVLVVGSSGDYLEVADTVLQMDCYVAKDVTARAAEIVRSERADKKTHAENAVCTEADGMMAQAPDADTTCLKEEKRIACGMTLSKAKTADNAVLKAAWLKKPVRAKQIEKVRVHGWDTLSLDKMEVDLRYLEQIVDESQTAALAYLMQYILERMANGKKTAAQLALEASQKIEKEGILSVTPKNYGAGAAAAVRRQEILACLARYRLL